MPRLDPAPSRFTSWFLRAFFATTVFVAETFAGDPAWKATGTLPAEEAFQAAAADEQSVYAIANRVVARYDRESGERVALSQGEAEHLNSGFLWEGTLYCAHSNYPKTPESSQIIKLDLDSMVLSPFQDFGESPHGSLTWAVRDADHWWCNFARYGEANAGTVLVKFDQDWNEQGTWTYPPEVLEKLGRYSISGGLWRGNKLLVTGHDDPVLFRLRLPEHGDVLESLGEIPAPFTGQGIAEDPKTGGMVGINRKARQVVFASLSLDQPSDADSED